MRVSFPRGSLSRSHRCSALAYTQWSGTRRFEFDATTPLQPRLPPTLAPRPIHLCTQASHHLAHHEHASKTSRPSAPPVARGCHCVAASAAASAAASLPAPPASGRPPPPPSLPPPRPQATSGYSTTLPSPRHPSRSGPASCVASPRRPVPPADPSPPPLSLACVPRRTTHRPRTDDTAVPRYARPATLAARLATLAPPP